MQLCLTPNRDGENNLVGRPYVSRVRVLEDRGDTIVVKVPGHKEATGYDRMAGGTTFSYVRVETLELEVVGRDTDRWGNEWAEVK